VYPLGTPVRTVITWVAVMVAVFCALLLYAQRPSAPVPRSEIQRRCWAAIRPRAETVAREHPRVRALPQATLVETLTAFVEDCADHPDAYGVEGR
jgi:hypothetical protein